MQLAQAELELVERVRAPELDDLFVGCGLLADLLEEEAVFVGEVRSEALVEHLDDFGQRQLSHLSPCRCRHRSGFSRLRVRLRAA